MEYIIFDEKIKIPKIIKESFAIKQIKILLWGFGVLGMPIFLVNMECIIYISGF